MNHKQESISSPPELAPYILKGESIISIVESPERLPSRPPSELRELYRLAQVKLHDEVGEFGPILASISLESDTDTSLDLHRYEALFGRDALRVAIDLLPLYPRLTRVTIVTLAKLQGLTTVIASEEEPGRIIHESRAEDDPIRIQLTKELGWGWPYYGSIDATPEFIRTIAAYCASEYEGPSFLFQKYLDKRHRPRIIADALTFAVDWILQRLDENPEGLLESHRSTARGIENQVWKDSWDAYFHHNGKIANHRKGVASIEVQRVAYDALIDAAGLYESVLGRKKEAVQLRQRAAKLQHTILTLFWTEEKGGYFILGTDRSPRGHIRKLKVRTSNMGHMLNSRLLEGDDPHIKRQREAIITHLFSPELLAPSGIRTLASDEIRFRPGAYHNGSVWLWDTYFIVQGLQRHGYYRLADVLSERLFHIIKVTKKFPEFVRGDTQREPNLNMQIIDVWDSINKRVNRIEQPPQEVQAWSVAAILALKHYKAVNYKISQRPPSSTFESKILDTID